MLTVRDIFFGEDGNVVHETLGDVGRASVAAEKFTIKGDINVCESQFDENVEDVEGRSWE